jgi:hypothetical protein
MSEQRSSTSQHRPARRARYALGATVAALVVALLGGALFTGASAESTRELVKVSFRPASARGLLGWRIDHGEGFDARRAFGWVRDNRSGDPVSMTDQAVARNRRANRTDTFIAMQPRRAPWGRWLLSVEPGTYRVTVTAGDPAAVAGRQYLSVEDTKVIDGFTPSRTRRTITETTDVTVTDGHLTIDPLYPNRSAAAKLVSVQVAVVLDDHEPPTPEPPTPEPPTTEPPTTEPPTTVPPTTVPPSGLRNQTGFASGGMFLSGSDADIKREMDGMAATGATWLRMPVLWSTIEQSPGVYYFNKMDQVVGWARDRGLNVVANVSYTPAWARPAGCNDMTCAPADLDLYARFMGNLVAHYAPLGVKTYEVWNEPNQSYWWKPRPNPARYTEMLTKAYVKAHQADDTVTILGGVFAPARDNEAGTTISPRTFLAGMYRAGVTGHFDALSFHPYTYPQDPRIIADWNMITGIGPDLAAMMTTNGDSGKKIWGTELAYPTGTSTKAVTETEQSRLTRYAVDTWRQQTYAGPLFFFNYRDMGTNPNDVTNNYGLVKRDFTPKQALNDLRNHLTH